MKQRIVFDAIYERLEELEYADVYDFGSYPEAFLNMTDRYFNKNLEGIDACEKSRILVMIVLYFLRNVEGNNCEVLFDSLAEDDEYRAASDFVNSTKNKVKEILGKSPISFFLTKKSNRFGDAYTSFEIFQNDRLYDMCDYSGPDDFFFGMNSFEGKNTVSIGEKEEVEVNEQNMLWYEMMHDSVRVDIDENFYEESVGLYNKISTASYANWLTKPEVKSHFKWADQFKDAQSYPVKNYLSSKYIYSENILDIWRILESPIVDIYEDALCFIDELLEPCIVSDKKGREFVDERLLNKVFKIKYRREYKEIELEVFKPVRDTFLALFEDVKRTTVSEGVTDETRLIRERLRSLTENDKCQYDNLIEYYLT